MGRDDLSLDLEGSLDVPSPQLNVAQEMKGSEWARLLFDSAKKRKAE
jgi:hypothetical protein